MQKMNPRDPETQRGEENKLVPALRHEMGGDLGPLRAAPLVARAEPLQGAPLSQSTRSIALLEWRKAGAILAKEGKQAVPRSEQGRNTLAEIQRKIRR